MILAPLWIGTNQQDGVTRFVYRLWLGSHFVPPDAGLLHVKLEMDRDVLIELAVREVALQHAPRSISERATRAPLSVRALISLFWFPAHFLSHHVVARAKVHVGELTTFRDELQMKETGAARSVFRPEITCQVPGEGSPICARVAASHGVHEGKLPLRLIDVRPLQIHVRPDAVGAIG